MEKETHPYYAVVVGASEPHGFSHNEQASVNVKPNMYDIEKVWALD